MFSSFWTNTNNPKYTKKKTKFRIYNFIISLALDWNFPRYFKTHPTFEH